MPDDAAVVIGVGPMGDRHLEAVAVECQALGHSFFTLDYTTLPAQGGLSIRLDQKGVRLVHLDRFVTALPRVHSIWWRRPDSPTIAKAVVDPKARRFAANEWHQVLNGVPHLLAGRFVNEPGACALAHSKAVQLATAAQIGLSTPRTLMTNRESDALAFITEIESYGGCVVLKTLGAMPDAAFPTRMVGPETKAALPQIRWAPVILQEYVAADTDVRAVVVGDQVYAAEITSAPSAYPHDYRVDLALARITPLTLPENVAGPLVSLAQRLGLDMGAADLRRTVDGGDAYCFLEINPSGEWLFLDEQTAGLVTSAVARLLTQPRSPEPGGRP